MLEVMQKAQLRSLDVLGIRSTFYDHLQQVHRPPILPRHPPQNVQEIWQTLIWAGSQSLALHTTPARGLSALRCRT